MLKQNGRWRSWKEKDGARNSEIADLDSTEVGRSNAIAPTSCFRTSDLSYQYNSNVSAASHSHNLSIGREGAQKHCLEDLEDVL